MNFKRLLFLLAVAVLGISRALGFAINIVQPTGTTVNCGVEYSLVAVGIPTSGTDSMINPKVMLYKNGSLYATASSNSLGVVSTDWTPNSNTVWTAYFYAGASQTQVASTSKTFAVTGNSAPTGNLTSYPSTWKKGDLFSIVGRCKDPELGAQGLLVNLWLDEKNVGSAIIDSSDLTTDGYRYYLDYRPTNLAPGTHTIKIKAQDSAGLTSTIATATFTVANANPTGKLELVDESFVPFPTSAASTYTLSKGTKFYIRISAQDADGNLSNLLWRLTKADTTHLENSGPVSRGDNFSGSTDFGPFTADSVGAWSIWGHAMDATAVSWNSVTPWTGQDYGWASFMGYTLNVTNAPQVTQDPVGNQTITLGQSVLLMSTVKDGLLAATSHSFDYCNPSGVWASAGGTGATIDGGTRTWSFSATGESRHSVRFTPTLTGTFQVKWTAANSAGTGNSNTYTITVLADANNNGIADSWETSNAITNTAKFADKDGDGIIDLAEFFLGTNPSVSNGVGNRSLPSEWASLVAGDNSKPYVVGSTKGEFSVDKGGGANYSIPFGVTPGIAGMEPKISLVYSSNSGAGIAGQGWNLSGLTGISRGPRTVVTDGYVRGIDFTNADAFYLDGQRLINIDGTNGADATEYRTENDSFSRVMSFGTFGNGPAWFKVWTKAGLICEYGNTADSQFNPGDGSVAGATAMSWQVNKISDTVGNYMSFTYEKDALSGTQLISRIDYTGSSGAAAFASIRFEYEDRLDKRFGYVNGKKTSSLKRLKTVKSYFGEAVVRSYELGYVTYETTTGRTVLQTVTERNRDGKTYSPLLFTYEDPLTPGWSSAQYRAPDLRPPTSLAIKNDVTGIGFTDVNGDGYPDLVQKTRNDAGVLLSNVWLNDKTGWKSQLTYRENGVDVTVQATQFKLPGNVSLAWKDRKDAGTRFVDVNGDGYVDILYAERLPNGTIESGLWFGSKTGWVDASAKKMTQTYLGHCDRPDAGRRIIDINGDGYPDILWYAEGSSGCLLNNVNLQIPGETAYWVSKPQWAPPFPIMDDVYGGAHFFDVNGDGLPDMVRNSIHDTDKSQVDIGIAINSSTGWAQSASAVSSLGEAYSTKQAKLGSLGKYLPPVLLSRDVVGWGQSVIGTEIADLNGDGLQDVFTRNSILSNGEGAAQAYFNTGNGWVTATNYIPGIELCGITGDPAGSRGVFVLDANGDGLPDLMQASRDYGLKCYLNTGTTWSASTDAYSYAPPIYMDNVDKTQPTGFQVADVDGDGLPDLVDNTNLYYNSFNPKVCKLLTVTNGMDVKLQVTYAALNEKANLADPLYKKGDVVAGTASIVGPMYVVNSVFSDDGIGGQRRVDYRYGELRTDPRYGSLGFAWTTTTDVSTNTTTLTEYSQTFPYIGMPVGTSTLVGTTLVSESDTIYGKLDLNAGKTRFIFATSSIQKGYELDGNLTSYAKTEVLPGDIDSYGNIKVIKVSKNSDGTAYQKTTSTFDNTVDLKSASARWLLGRLRTASVESAIPNPNSDPRMGIITRASAFEYDPTTGLLTKETVQPVTGLDSSNVMLVSTYGYDAWGNKISVTTTGTENYIDALTSVAVQKAFTRATTTSYDPAVSGSIDVASNVKGRFPYKTTNAALHSEYYKYDHQLGVVTQLRGPNSKDSFVEYDGFGNKVKSTSNDGNYTTATTAWATAGITGNPKYFILTRSYSSAGTEISPPAAQFFDRLGRPVVGFAINGGDLSGNLRIVATNVSYDSLGRAYKKSLPYAYGTIPRYFVQTVSYDAVGRPLEIRTPNDALATGYIKTAVAYTTEGTTEATRRLVTTTTTYGASANKSERLEKNLFGQTMRTVNNSTGTGVEKGAVNYVYDTIGNLVQTDVENGAERIPTTFSYDIRGRKISMTDVDKGTWSYQYNSAGELIQQVNSSNQQVLMSYDALGRLVSRVEPEGTTNWTFDQSAPGMPAATWYGALFRVKVTRVSGDTTFASGATTGATDGYTEDYVYDSFGRQTSVTKYIEGDTLATGQTYDAVGRPLGLTYPSGYKTKNIYDNYGFLRRVVSDYAITGAFGEIPVGYVFWKADSYTLDGKIECTSLGNGVTQDRLFSESTGQVYAIDIGQGLLPNTLYHEYSYDEWANVTMRRDWASNRFEKFTYDGLNRLSSYSLNGGAATSMGYDAIGNITNKSDVGSYAYNATKRHLFSTVTTASGNYSVGAYDARGNITTLNRPGYGAFHLYTWSSFDQLKKVQSYGGYTETDNSTFSFGANHERVRQVTKAGVITLYAGAHFERIKNGATTEDLNYIMTPAGRTAVRRTINGSVETRYFHQDSLGSVMAVTDEVGRLEKRHFYDAWGKQTKTVDTHVSTSGSVTRGFTDHEMLNQFGLIHMNGRVYDSTLGRFLSADPFVQSPNDSQSYNRYSYLMNNPLGGTDPSGYFSFKHLFGALLFGAAYFINPSFFNQYGGQIAGIVVTAVVSYFCGPVIGGMAGGFVSGFTGSLLNGGSIGDAFKAGLIGGVIGGASGATGLIGNVYVRAAANAVMGGVISEATGGDFKHGFYAGLATAVMSPSIGAAAKQNWYAGMIMQAVVGGTGSVIGGGKFLNGAAIGAFQYAVSNVPTGAQLRSSPLAGAGIAGKMIIDRVVGENYGAAWRSMFTEKWDDGPTGGKLPRSLANGLADIKATQVPDNARENGMHAWHAGSNAYLAGKFGLIGAPLIAAGGVFHESPFDWGSFQAEQHWQGTVNHVLDSTMDLFANAFGMAVGYLNPGSVGDAVTWGNHIPGPGDPDPKVGGRGTPYTGNPVDDWGPYR